MSPMQVRRRQLVALLAAVIALRALVPLGYMLESNGGRLLDLALALCPQQNPALDLSQLDGARGPHGLHAHHGHAAADGGAAPGTDSATGIDNTCQLWTGSAADITVSVVASPWRAAAANERPLAAHTAHVLRFPRVAGARAPPALRT